MSSEIEMKIIVSRDSLKETATILKNIKNRTSHALLDNCLIKINVTENIMEISRINMEIKQNIFLNIEVIEGKGNKEIIIHIDRLISGIDFFNKNLDLIWIFEEPFIIFQHEKEKARVFYEENNGMYPMVNTIEKEKYNIYIMKTKDLIDNLKKVEYAICKDVEKKELTGVLFELNSEKINFISTDGKRLAKTGINLTACEENIKLKNNKIICDGSVVSHIIKFEKFLIKEELVTLKLTSQEVEFYWKNNQIGAINVDREFPEYKHIVPEHADLKLNINISNFHKALKKLKKSTKSDSYIFFMQIYKDKTIVQNMSMEGRIEIESESWLKEEEVSNRVFDLNQVVDVLNVLKNQETLEWRLQENHSRVTKMNGENDKNSFHLLMPVVDILNSFKIQETLEWKLKNKIFDNGRFSDFTFVPVSDELLCLSCKWFASGSRCMAFPKGIPDEIIEGKVKHDKQYPGDHGIQYEKIEK